MFGVLCEVVIYNREFTGATYLEAVPCALASRIPQITGHNVPAAVLIIALEYGKNFSGPAKDPFYLNRAIGEAEEAHKSNFLHPVLYHYKRLPSHEGFLSRPPKWILPVPNRIHHIMEDFTTKFDGQIAHILPLRHFIETTTGRDLRFYYAGQCMMLAMSHTVLPLSCNTSNELPSHNMVVENKQLKKQLMSLPPQLLPFEFLE